MNLDIELATAARQFAFDTNDRDADTRTTSIELTVINVEPGLGRGGTSRVTVRWRGKPVIVSGYLDSYTPAGDDRVLCIYTASDQLYITGRLVGQP